MTSITSFLVVLILGNFCLKYKFPVITAKDLVSHSGFKYIGQLISKDAAEKICSFSKETLF